MSLRRRASVKPLMILPMIVCLVLFTACPNGFLGGVFGGADGVDSDGDGYTDAEERENLHFDPENNPAKFNPYIADLPRIGLSITSVPTVRILGKISETVDETIETDWSESETTGYESTEMSSVATTMSHTLGVKVSAETGFSVGTNKVSTETSYEFSHSEQVTNSFTRQHSGSRAYAYSRANTLKNSRTSTIDGGEIVVTVTIRNKGEVGFTLNGITLSAVAVEPFATDAPVTPLADLIPDSDFGSGQYLAPAGQEGSQIVNGTFTGTIDSPDTALRLLNDMNNICVQISRYQMTDDENKQFGGDLTNVNAKTFTLVMDYGPSSDLAPETYHISPEFDDDADGVTLDEVFAELFGLDYECGEVPNGEDTVHCLTSLRGRTGDPAPGGWVIAHTYSNAGVDETRAYSPAESYELTDIEVKRGDRVLLMWVEDKDSDGLTAREELMYGTSDEDADTDGDCDGIADVEKNDFEEIEAGTNPLFNESSGESWPPTISIPDVGNSNVAQPGAAGSKLTFTWNNPNDYPYFENAVIVELISGSFSAAPAPPPTGGQHYRVGHTYTDDAGDRMYEIVAITNSASFDLDTGVLTATSLSDPRCFTVFGSDMVEGRPAYHFSPGAYLPWPRYRARITLSSLECTEDGDGDGTAELYWSFWAASADGHDALIARRYQDNKLTDVDDDNDNGKIIVSSASAFGNGGAGSGSVEMLLSGTSPWWTMHAKIYEWDDDTFHDTLMDHYDCFGVTSSVSRTSDRYIQVPVSLGASVPTFTPVELQTSSFGGFSETDSLAAGWSLVHPLFGSDEGTHVTLDYMVTLFDYKPR